MKGLEMKRGKRTYIALVAAVAASTLAVALPAMGQMRVDTTGHALDANNQIGTGGYNLSGSIPNGTGGAGFRGGYLNANNAAAKYGDPFAYRGLIPGQGVDQFISASTGLPITADPFAASVQAKTTQQIYGGFSNTSQSSKYQALLTSMGYLPPLPVTQSPEDTRLGAVDFTQGPILPKPNEMLVPGPVDPTANPSTASPLFAASPLYGVRQWQFNASQIQGASGQSLNQGSSLFGSQSPLQQGSGINQFTQGPDQVRLIQMRQELNNSSKNGSQQLSQGSIGATLLQPMRPGMQSNTNSSAGQALQPLSADTSQLKSTNLAPTAGDVSTAQTTRQYLSNVPVPPPSQQSAQVALLQQMVQKYDASHPKTDEQANLDFQRILKLHQMAATNAEQGSNVLAGPKTNEPGAGETAPGTANPDMGPGTPTDVGPAPAEHGTNNNLIKPGFSTLPNLQGMSQPPAAAQPVPIDSFATGMKARGLADLIATGESLVQQQQYDRAIASYNDAIQVAPNNPLILTARANAELGGGYYAQAFADLHTAITQDPAVLIGRYDLQKHLGADRLKALSDDLKLISKDSPKDATHAFLYAYVLYNSHHVGMAAEWVDTADKRAGGQDPAITAMKKYWNFSEEFPTAPSTPTK
jgi:tetratricopeptide (TPR) repeat protein